MAFSSAALAMRLPRTCLKILRAIAAVFGCGSAASIGPSSWVMTAQALSVDSRLKNTDARRPCTRPSQSTLLNAPRPAEFYGCG